MDTIVFIALYLAWAAYAVYCEWKLHRPTRKRKIVDARPRQANEKKAG